MTPEATQHPAPHAHRMSVSEIYFCLFAGPFVWLLQLSCGYALASEPCFRRGGRDAAPPASLGWTWSAMVLLTVAAVAVAIIALVVSWRAFERTRTEHLGGADHLLEAGVGRTRFVALWGVILSAGFAIAAAVSAIAYIAVPRCTG
jgi:hypothetical protein